MKKIKKDKKTIKTIIPLLLISFTLLFCVSTVSAANDTIYVNTTGNDTSGNGTAENPYLTIQKGIDTAVGYGTIKIANGTYKGTNNTQITIIKNINIVGESQTETIINGENTNWIFQIFGVNVNIQNLTITNATGDIGTGSGTIRNWYGTLNVNGCTFTNNTANGYSYGGVISSVGTMTIINSTFTHNTAYCGGAIENDGTCTVTDSTFTGNNAVHSGGAISNTGTLTIINSNFTGNTANGYGGAIYHDRGNLIIFGNIFTGNTVNIFWRCYLQF